MRRIYFKQFIRCLLFYNTCNDKYRRVQCRFCKARKYKSVFRSVRRTGIFSTLCRQTSLFLRVQFFECFRLVHNQLFCSFEAFFLKSSSFFQFLIFKLEEQIFKLSIVRVCQNNTSPARRAENHTRFNAVYFFEVLLNFRNGFIFFFAIENEII